MATITAAATGKLTRTIKNVKPRDVEQKIENLENQGFTRISVNWGRLTIEEFKESNLPPMSIEVEL